MDKEKRKYSNIKKLIPVVIGIFIIIALIFSAMDKRDFDKEFDNGSNIKVENLSKNQVENLKKLCKVWGLVKYYHPKVVSGSVNWDYELFRITPDILASKNSNNTNKILYDWVMKLGKVKEKSENDKDKEVMLKRDLAWIKDEKYIDKDLSDLLIKISNTNISKRAKSYVAYSNDSEFSDFKNEKAYNNMKYDDSGYKLLSLFRYWNIIEYYYPYKDIIEENWDSVLTEFIPKFIETKDELEYKLAISELATKIHDPHAIVSDTNGTLDKYRGDKYAPIEFGLIENQIVIKNVLLKYEKVCKLKKGDIVLKINDKDIFEVIKEKSKYASLSKKSAIVNRLQYELFATSKDSMNLTIKRDDKEITQNVKCYSDTNMFDIDEDSHKLIDKNIGYINPEKLAEGEIDKIMDKFMDTKGLIVDLRYYPSDFIVYSLGKYLMPKEVTFAKVSIPNQSVPGEFILTEDLKVGSNNKNYYKGKVVILMNERSQSQSEFTVMSLRNAPNAKVIGSDSIGTDGNVANFSLPGGVSTLITGIGIYNSDKSQTQRVGIKPDIYIEPTIQGVKEGRDEILEKAIEIIN
ncbi:carboxyl-terminal protease [[Clostridium] sordellii]|uniref:S41 family peptidase n=1 Tax=Paraclostridium sordellii TaxID=1505 RepID=UPI0005E69D60|nr:S41 family peptidase [Paeniclostridium sordellii]CEP90297.1 carboxyl-terminal protease [[Clostridium] sordellii] [Paeniclostridium sordellii]